MNGVHIRGGDGLRVAAPRHPCVGNDEQNVAGMVEDDEGVAQEKDGFGDGQAGHGRFGQFLKLAHNIVAQVANRPPAKAGQTRQTGGHKIGQFILENVQQVTAVGQFVALGALFALISDGAAVLAQHGAGVDPHKRIAPQLLPPFDGFEEERRPHLVRQFEVNRDGGLEVGRKLAVDGYQVGFPLGKGVEFFEGWLVHSG